MTKLLLILFGFIAIIAFYFLYFKGAKLLSKKYAKFSSGSSKFSFWTFLIVISLFLGLVSIGLIRKASIVKDFSILKGLNPDSIPKIEITVVQDEDSIFRGAGILIQNRKRIKEYSKELSAQEDFNWNHPQTVWAVKIRLYNTEFNVHGFLIEKIYDSESSVSYFGLNPSRYNGPCLTYCSRKLEQMILDDFKVCYGNN
jgi:hypothetical protein